MRNTFFSLGRTRVKGGVMTNSSAASFPSSDSSQLWAMISSLPVLLTVIRASFIKDVNTTREVSTFSPAIAGLVTISVALDKTAESAFNLRGRSFAHGLEFFKASLRVTFVKGVFRCAALLAPLE